MYKFDEVMLDYETRGKILSRIPSFSHEPGMSEFDSAFLCGLLKELKPKKIVEVGVAGGATTSVILQCMEDIGNAYEMYSVDLSETVWHTPSMKTGSITEYAKKLLSPRNHEFFIGSSVVKYLSHIGTDIDFVILDTVHRVPGEMLDFLALLPYCKSGAVVCLHDIVTCQTLEEFETSDYYATNILFSVVSGDKYISFHQKRLSNIAAFKITEETLENVYSVFCSLNMTWSYLPEKQLLEEYTGHICKFYDEVAIRMYKQALNFNIMHFFASIWKG